MHSLRFAFAFVKTCFWVGSAYPFRDDFRSWFPGGLPVLCGGSFPAFSSRVRSTCSYSSSLDRYPQAAFSTSTTCSDWREAFALTWVESVTISFPSTSPFSMHWRTICKTEVRYSSFERNRLRRFWDRVEWSGTRSSKSSPKNQRYAMFT